MTMLQFTRRGFLLHETVSMCCTLCDNTGRESIGNRIEGPRINSLICATQSGVFRIKLYREPASAHREGAGRGGGVAEGQLPFLQGSLHLNTWRTSAALGRVL